LFRFPESGFFPREIIARYSRERARALNHPPRVFVPSIRALKRSASQKRKYSARAPDARDFWIEYLFNSRDETCRFLFRRRGKLLSPEHSAVYSPTLPFQADMAGFPFYANGRETETDGCAKRGNDSLTSPEHVRPSQDAMIRSIHRNSIDHSHSPREGCSGERMVAAQLPLNLSALRDPLAPEKRIPAMF